VEEAPGAAVLPDDLLDPVPEGDLPVLPPPVHPVDGHGQYYEVGPVQRLLPVDRPLHLEARAGLLSDLLGQGAHRLESLGADVVEDEVRALEVPDVGGVEDGVVPELAAPCPDEHDARLHENHFTLCPKTIKLLQGTGVSTPQISLPGPAPRRCTTGGRCRSRSHYANKDAQAARIRIFFIENYK